jgi:hypothetical protein
MILNQLSSNCYIKDGSVVKKVIVQESGSRPENFVFLQFLIQ